MSKIERPAIPVRLPTDDEPIQPVSELVRYVRDGVADNWGGYGVSVDKAIQLADALSASEARNTAQPECICKEIRAKAAEIKNPFEPHSWGFQIWRDGFDLGRVAARVEIDYTKEALDKCHAENSEYFDKSANLIFQLDDVTKRLAVAEARAERLAKCLEWYAQDPHPYFHADIGKRAREALGGPTE